MANGRNTPPNFCTFSVIVNLLIETYAIASGAEFFESAICQPLRTAFECQLKQLPSRIRVSRPPPGRAMALSCALLELITPRPRSHFPNVLIKIYRFHCPSSPA